MSFLKLFSLFKGNNKNPSVKTKNKIISTYYYRFKYRPRKGKNGAMSIAILHHDKNNTFKDKLNTIASTISPSHKSNTEVLAYIKTKYDLKETELSESELINFKINYILNIRPDVLHTPKIVMPRDKNPSRKQYLEFSENSDKRFHEARNYPLDKLGLKLKTYSFKHSFDSGNNILFQVICEDNTDEIFVYGYSNSVLSENESEIMFRIDNDIILSKGITQNDIDNRTNKFIGYAAALIKQENGDKNE